MTRAAVAILQRENKILVCQRKKNSRYALKWEFPGGKLEEGETVSECVKREVREELSIIIDAVDRTETLVNRYDDGGVFEVTYFYVTRFSGEPSNNAFEQFRWVGPSELKSLDILEGNKPVVEKLIETLSSKPTTQ